MFLHFGQMLFGNFVKWNHCKQSFISCVIQRCLFFAFLIIVLKSIKNKILYRKVNCGTGMNLMSKVANWPETICWEWLYQHYLGSKFFFSVTWKPTMLGILF
jgi:hypothetical protein